MDCFQPGHEQGYDYQHFIWVCVNPVGRSFEKCDPESSVAVRQMFLQKLQEYGLSRSTFVFNSGCMLGCKQAGTTVAIGSRQPLNNQQEKLLYFRNVTVEDVDALIQILLKASR